MVNLVSSGLSLAPEWAFYSYIQLREVYKPLQINTWLRLEKTATWEVNSNSETNYKPLNLSRYNLASFSREPRRVNRKQLLNSHMSQVTWHLAHNGVSLYISSLKYKCQTIVLGGNTFSNVHSESRLGFHNPWKCGYYSPVVEIKASNPRR